MPRTPARRLYAILTASLLALIGLAAPAQASTTYTTKVLWAQVGADGRVGAGVTMRASTSTKAQTLDVCVQSSSGANVDLPGVTSVVITTSGTAYQAAKVFAPGTYTYWGCLSVGGNRFDLSPRKTFTVPAAPASTPTPTSPPPSPTSTGAPTRRSGYWWSDFESPTALTPSTGSPAPGAEWSGWGQGDTATYGVPHVVSAATEKLPTPPSGDRVVKLRHSGPQSPFGGDRATGPHNMHKLYKQFTSKTWPAGAEPTKREDGTPDDVSGRYITELYIPSSQLNLVRGYWSNVMQFKEDYQAVGGGFVSNPSWWVGFNAFDPAHSVLNLSSAGGRHQGPSIPLAPLTDRWVQLELRLYQHDRLEFYIDGKLVDTGRDSEVRVGRANYVGQSGTSGTTVAKTLGWTFGVGNYTDGNDYPAGASGVYVDLSCVLPLT